MNETKFQKSATSVLEMCKRIRFSIRHWPPSNVEYSTGQKWNVEYSPSEAPPSNIEHSISAGCSLQFLITHYTIYIHRIIVF